jgi:hypothetical protein
MFHKKGWLCKEDNEYFKLEIEKLYSELDEKLQIKE